MHLCRQSLLLLLLPGCLCFPFPRPAPWPIPAAIPVPLPLPLAQHSPPNLYNLPSQSSPILDAAQPRDYKVYKPEVGRVKIQVRGTRKKRSWNVCARVLDAAYDSTVLEVTRSCSWNHVKAYETFFKDKLFVLLF